MTYHTDVLVIGSGIAGLFFALKAAESRRVMIVTKKQAVESNTNYAQGGIASVIANDDGFDLHVADTLRAGAGLCNREAVEIMVREGPGLVNELVQLGVDFTREQGKLDLGREGGHSRNRIVHARDLTGREIERALTESIRVHPNVTVFENHVAIDLITEHNLEGNAPRPRTGVHCWGAFVLDRLTQEVKRFLAGATVLATGGAGQTYLHTTNPAIATGDGVAIAYRAGAEIANMEFVQFHPTTLYHPEGNSFLISEALRGYGAYLRNKSGERFMERYDERKELAPRDVVARAIDAELKRSGDECVYLDITHKDHDETRKHFPHIHYTCLMYGIDIATQQIPVVPAAHYQCGGVATNLDGRTTITGLYACGETAMTGVHGANRLASNSLLEALVFADRAARDLKISELQIPPVASIRAWDESGTQNTEEWVLVSHNKREVQQIMWDYVGIVRSDLRLQRARRRLDMLLSEIEEFYKRARVTAELIELRNLARVADLIIRCAVLRRESRGLHATTDYPDPPQADAQEGKNTIVTAS